MISSALDGKGWIGLHLQLLSNDYQFGTSIALSTSSNLSKFNLNGHLPCLRVDHHNLHDLNLISPISLMVGKM